jgi:hypothetical protein
MPSHIEIIDGLAKRKQVKPLRGSELSRKIAEIQRAGLKRGWPDDVMQMLEGVAARVRSLELSLRVASHKPKSARKPPCGRPPGTVDRPADRRLGARHD